MPTQPESTQQSTNADDGAQPMHIFDIRRSNSVTELWKKFECEPQSPILQRAEVDDTEKSAEDAPSHAQAPEGGPSDTDHQSTSGATIEPSEPLLAAFEAELAKILDASEAANAESNAQHDSSRAPDFDRPQNPADAFNSAIHNLVDGAQMIHAGVRSRIPDFESQLRDAQRALPEQVGSTLQSALTAMESRVRNLTDAIHNTAAARAQRSNISFPGGIPNSVDGLRSMASELGQMGQTLFEAFENEFGCNAPRDHGEETGESSQPEGQAQSRPTNESSVNGSGPASGDQQSRPNGSSKDEKESLNRTGEASSNDQDVRLPGSFPDSGPSTQPQQQPKVPCQAPTSDRDDHTQRPGYQRPPVDLPHRAHEAHRHPPFYNPLHLPPPRPHHMPHNFAPPPRPHHRPHHFAPPPPPFQAPMLGSFWHPGSWYPGNPPPPPPHPRNTWNSGWPSFFGHTHNHNNGAATTAGPSAPPKAAQAPQTCHSSNKTLFIGNVGFNVTEKMIQEVFAAQGFLVDVHMPVDSETKKHAGFGYLHFASIHAAKAALEALQGTHIDGHSINLEFSDHSLITNIQTSRDGGESTSQADSHSPKADTASPTSKLPEPQQPADTSAQEKLAPSTERDANNTAKPGSSPEPRNTRSEIPTLLDGDNENSTFSVRYPSLTPEVRAQQSATGRLPNLSPELGMGRFPPVSQLDARMVANHGRGTESTEGNSGSQAEPQVLRHSSFRDFSQGQPRPTSDRPHRTRSGRLLRRSNTMMPAHPGSRLTGPFDPLGSTESHSAARGLQGCSRSLLFNPQDSGSSTRQSGILGDNTSWNTSENSHAGNEPQKSASNSTINRIDNCVNTLAGLGYGSTEEGGHHRLAVYAAAADGKVNDAIEMIEDERKVYAQRR